jgi:NYN domain/OST-HTH/LOTUS domain
MKQNLAILIDGDNVHPKNIDEAFSLARRFGAPDFKKVFALNLAPWKKACQRFSIEERLCPGGKNSTDWYLGIEAMTLVLERKFSKFCIFSSDADFVPLVNSLIQRGCTVYIFGLCIAAELKKTKAKCFTLGTHHEEEIRPAIPKPATVAKSHADELYILVTSTFKRCCNNQNSWIGLTQFGRMIRKIDPSFDSRKYGERKLSDLLKSLTYVSIARSSSGGMRARMAMNGNSMAT